VGHSLRDLVLANFQFGDSETDMMNETAAIDDEGHPVSCHERKARVSLIGTFAVGLHQGQQRAIRPDI
jgi:hypothetical protein